MKKEEVIQIFVNYMQQAIDFSMAKAPELLQQYVHLKCLYYGVAILFCILILVILFLVIKQICKNAEDDNDNFFLIPCGFLWITIFGSTVVIFIQFLGLCLYPQAWLLQHFLQ